MAKPNTTVTPDQIANISDAAFLKLPGEGEWGVRSGRLPSGDELVIATVETVYEAGHHFYLAELRDKHGPKFVIEVAASSSIGNEEGRLAVSREPRFWIFQRWTHPNKRPRWVNRSLTAFTVVCSTLQEE